MKSASTSDGHTISCHLLHLHYLLHHPLYLHHLVQPGHKCLHPSLMLKVQALTPISHTQDTNGCTLLSSPECKHLWLSMSTQVWHQSDVTSSKVTSPNDNILLWYQFHSWVQAKSMSISNGHEWAYAQSLCITTACECNKFNFFIIVGRVWVSPLPLIVTTTQAAKSIIYRSMPPPKSLGWSKNSSVGCWSKKSTIKMSKECPKLAVMHKTFSVKKANRLWMRLNC